MLRSILFLFSLFTLTFSQLALADQSLTLQTEKVFTYPSIKDGNGAIYGTFVNKGNSDVNIISATSPAVKTVELHTMSMENNMMRMRAVPFYTVPAKGRLTLQSGAEHIMLIGLVNPIKAGDSFPVTLKLDNGNTQTITVNAIARGSNLNVH